MATSPDRIENADRGARVTPARAAAIAGGILLLLVLVWFLFLRSDEVEPDASAPAPAAEAPVEDEPEVTSPGKNGPVETFEVFAPKDPFDPLISASTGTGQTTEDPAEAAVGTTDATATMDAGVAGDGTGTTTTTTTTPRGGDEGGDRVGGHRVRVVDVFRDDGSGRAQVQVDGTVYTVDEGERFAENFQLMSTSGQCATMLFGDDEFTLCEGEEILK